MKKLSIWQKLRLLRRAQDQLRHRRRIRSRRQRAIHGLSTRLVDDATKTPLHKISVYRRGKVRFGLAREKRPMPENFCLVENYDVVSTFLGQLRHDLTISGRKLEATRLEGGVRRRQSWEKTIVESYIDFATLKRITPATALVLASEYDRVITVFRATEWLRAINVDQWNPEVLQTLIDVGFLSLLGVDKAANIAERDGTITVPFLSGAKVHGATIDKLIKGMAALADSSGLEDSNDLLMRSRVYDGLGEAIQNVWDHAYPLGAFDEYPVAKKWWMTGSVQPSKKRFTIAIYDHGVSIPVSLPRWKRFAEFRMGFAKTLGLEYDITSTRYDGETIAQAVQLGQSSTGQPWHGKGLPVIKNIVDNCKGGGTVRILSRNGRYSVYGRPEADLYVS